VAPANIKNFEIKLGKTGVIIVALGMAALLFVSFLFGVDVGKNIDVYPERIAALPAQLISWIWRPEKIQLEANGPGARKDAEATPEENINLTFYDALTKNKNDHESFSAVNGQGNVIGNNTDRTANLDTDHQIETGPVVVPKAKPNEERENPKATAKSVNTDKESARKEESGKSSDHHFTVQVVSLKEEKDADAFSKKISSLGYHASVVKVALKRKGTVYRVVVKGFDTREHAQEAADKIEKAIKIKCFVRSTGNHKN